MIDCPCHLCDKRSQRCRIDCPDWKEYEARAKEDKEKLRAYKHKYMYSAKLADLNKYLIGLRNKKKR